MSEMSPVSVLVAIVAYRSEATLSRAIASLTANLPAWLTLRIDVWDNSSSLAEGRSPLPDGIRIHGAGTNMGFAHGTNRVVADAPRTDWVLLLNPDAWVHEGFWSELATSLRSDADIVVPQVVDENGSSRNLFEPEPAPVPEFAYALCGERARTAASRRGDPANVYASGACLLIRRSAWDTLNGFDERYFLFGEDADLFRRARAAGLRITAVPEAVVGHLGSKGTASKTPFAQLCLIAAKTTYLAANAGQRQARAVHAAYRTGAALRWLAHRVKSRPDRAAIWAPVALSRFDQLLWFRWLHTPSRAPDTVLLWPGRAGAGTNPYAAEFHAALERTGMTVREFTGLRSLIPRAAVFHAHWPDALLNARGIKSITSPALLIVAALLLRLRGTRIVWTVHNLGPHDARVPGLTRPYLLIWARLVSGALYHTSASRDIAEQLYPPLKRVHARVALLPSYAGTHGAGPSPSTMAQRPATTTVVFVGTLRRYKNVEALLRAFSEVGDPRWRLRVQGPPHDPRYASELVEMATELGLDGSVEPRWLDDEELLAALQAASLLVIPVERALNSSTLVLGLSVGVPVLAPRTPTNSELAARFPDAAMCLYDPPLRGRDLQNAVVATASQRGVRVPLPSWDDLAREASGLYEYITTSRTSMPDPLEGPER